MAQTIASQDPYTAGHRRRVSELGSAIANELGMPKDQVRGVEFGALIHDLDKISVPAEILNQPGTA